jgi:ABC-type Fe3+-hydroxamate transport system substrate-binding protein
LGKGILLYHLSMIKIKDQLGNETVLQKIPTRIISLVPSQTELLFDLGLDDEVIGITKFCIHPESWFRKKTKVGGTKNPDITKIRSLFPDLILCNKEENDIKQVTELSKEFPVWVSDIKTLDDALEMISAIGILTGRKEKATDISAKIKNEFYNYMPGKKIDNCIYLVWKDPVMMAGRDTFISAMMETAGFVNSISENRYPVLTDSARISPTLVLLPSEPFPFSEKHKAWANERFPASTPVLVDGEMFSWYGSHLLRAPSYFAKLNKQLPV